MVDIIASEIELPPERCIWGTGGWQMPEQREALDWLTLCRLLGWNTEVVGRSIPESSRPRVIVLARAPDELQDDSIAQLRRRLATEPLLIVARAGYGGRAFEDLTGARLRPETIGGRSIKWCPGSFRTWFCRRPLEAVSLELSHETTTWCTLDGAPLIVARKEGRGIVATLAFHPSRARDTDGAATALLKHLLIWGCPSPVAWLELAGTLVLRMDDPGGAQNVFSSRLRYSKVEEAGWIAIGADLERRNARLSVGYVSGWVDDGNTARGVLEIGGKRSPRIPGKVHPSPLVQYEDVCDGGRRLVHDYAAEFRGIEALRKAGLADVELHGYTHMHPDTSAWASASDKYESVQWYRELGKSAAATIASRPASQHPLALGMMAFRRFFKMRPTTLICPGDQWTNDALTCALQLGLRLVGSYYLALRDGNRFCWSQHVCAPYLDKPDSAWFDSELPVVGYFHDFDICRNGVEWFSNYLDRWQSAGAARLIDYRELAAAVSRRLCIEERRSELHLTVFNEDGPALVRPLRIAFRVSEGCIPSRITTHFDDREISLPVETFAEAVGVVQLPGKCDGLEDLSGADSWRA